MTDSAHRRTEKGTAEEEAKNLLSFYRDDMPAAISLLERQLSALHLRAQVLIGFGAVVLTTTGFSGRLIAGTNVSAQISIILGLATVLAACLHIFLRVMRVQWVVSSCLGRPPIEALSAIITHRDRKTTAYRHGSYVLFAGLALYAIAIAIMLLNPEPLTVPSR